MDESFVRVRVKLLMNAEGRWAAYGWIDASERCVDFMLQDTMSGEDIEISRSFYLVADIPLPKAIEIAAAVEPEKENG